LYHISICAAVRTPPGIFAYRLTSSHRACADGSARGGDFVVVSLYLLAIATVSRACIRFCAHHFCLVRRCPTYQRCSAYCLSDRALSGGLRLADDACCGRTSNMAAGRKKTYRCVLRCGAPDDGITAIMFGIFARLHRRLRGGPHTAQPYRRRISPTPAIARARRYWRLSDWFVCVGNVTRHKVVLRR